MWSGGYNIIPYTATQSLLPSPFKQLIISSKILRACTIINETQNIRYKYNYEAECYLYIIISVKLMIILLLPIYIFLNMNSLRTQMFNFIRTITQLYLIILLFTSYTHLLEGWKVQSKVMCQIYTIILYIQYMYSTLYSTHSCFRLYAC